MKKTIFGVFLTLAGVAILVFLAWTVLPDQHGISPHLTVLEAQAVKNVGISGVALLVSGILLFVLPRLKRVKEANNADK